MPQVRQQGSSFAELKKQGKPDLAHHIETVENDQEKPPLCSGGVPQDVAPQLPLQAAHDKKADVFITRYSLPQVFDCYTAL